MAQENIEGLRRMSAKHKNNLKLRAEFVDIATRVSFIQRCLLDTYDFQAMRGGGDIRVKKEIRLSWNFHHHDGREKNEKIKHRLTNAETEEEMRGWNVCTHLGVAVHLLSGCRGKRHLEDNI